MNGNVWIHNSSPISVNQSNAGIRLCSMSTASSLNVSSTASKPVKQFFCDRPEHKMYRAVQSNCPCRTQSERFMSHQVIERGGVWESEEDVFIVEKSGLMRSLAQLIRRVEEQEVTIARLQRIIEQDNLNTEVDNGRT